MKQRVMSGEETNIPALIANLIYPSRRMHARRACYKKNAQPYLRALMPFLVYESKLLAF